MKKRSLPDYHLFGRLFCEKKQHKKIARNIFCDMYYVTCMFYT